MDVKYPTHSQNASQLLQKISDQTAKIAILGLGYVGLPLIKAFCQAGFTTLGIDVDQNKIQQLQEGQSYIRHISSSDIQALNETGRFHVSTEFSRLREADCVILCVPTPLTRQREPDLRFINATTEKVSEYLREGQLVVLESSTYPGTTTDIVRPRLEAGGKKSGIDFFLAYSPEREDPGNINFTTTQIPKVVGGDGKDALSVALALYDCIIERTVPVSSTQTAEAVKLTENIFRAVNIALVNELKIIFKNMDVDIWEVIEAAKTKPFGFMPFYPGPGLGGHCIPIDPFYLTWKAREFGISTRFIELAGEINTFMPRYVVSQISAALNQRFQKALNGSKILLVGLAYKKNVDDTRESPSFTIYELLEKKGAKLSFHDPYVSKIPHLREFPELAGKPSTPLTKETLKEFDVAVICTDHDDVDYPLIKAHCPLIVDTRNVFATLGIQDDDVIKA